MEEDINRMGRLASEGEIEPLVSTFIHILKKIDNRAKMEEETPLKEENFIWFIHPAFYDLHSHISYTFLSFPAFLPFKELTKCLTKFYDYSCKYDYKCMADQKECCSWYVI